MILTGVKRLFDEVSSIALPESDQSGKTEQEAPAESLNTMKPGSKKSVLLGDARHVRTGGTASSKHGEISSSSSSIDDEIDRIAKQTVDEAFSRPFSPLPRFPKVRKIALGQGQPSIPCGITDEFENFSLSERVNEETESSESFNAKPSRVLIRVRVPRRLKKKVRDGETNKAKKGGRKTVISIGSPRPAPNVQRKASRTRMRDVSERLFEYINAYRDYSGARILDWNEMLYEICVVGTTVMVPSRRMKEYYPNIGVDYVWLGLKMDLTDSGQKEDEKRALCGKVGTAIMTEILSKKVHQDKILEKSASYMAVDVFGSSERILCNVIMTGMPPFTNKPKRHDEIAREATDALKMKA